ncbi:MAG TPA: fibronectin type III domain-containing protein [Methanospirillum sp.]|nr:fibronectin type III domain-containing protein [Methanospirillum sp.]
MVEFLKEPDISHQKNYESLCTHYSGMLDSANAIEPTSDGGCIIAGNIIGKGISCAVDLELIRTVPKTAYIKKVWIVNIDISGRLIWQKSYGFLHDISATDIEVTRDGGYAIITWKYDSNPERDNTVIKLDPLNPSIASPSISDITSSSARITANNTQSDEQITVWCECQEFGTDKLYRTPNQTVNSTTQYTANLTDLVPDTNYECKVLAANSSWITHGESIILQTL